MRCARIVLIPLILAVAACTTVDEERHQMRSTIDSAGTLAGEITTWRASLTGDIPATVVNQIEDFQARAENMLSTLDGLSDEATAGSDLTALEHALRALEEFDTSRVEDSSATNRASLLDQFQGLAGNLQTAVARVRQR